MVTLKCGSEMEYSEWVDKLNHAVKRAKALESSRHDRGGSALPPLLHSIPLSLSFSRCLPLALAPACSSRVLTYTISMPARKIDRLGIVERC